MRKLSWLSPKTEVRKSPIHGRGLFVRRPIHKGEVVAVKGGHVYNRRRHDWVEEKLGPADIQIGDNLFIGPLTHSEVAGSMIWSNHSCNPNTGLCGEITFVAMRKIKAGEELMHDWAMTDNEDYRMRCNCGARNCRKIITGSDWKKPALQKRYRGYFSSYLAHKMHM